MSGPRQSPKRNFLAVGLVFVALMMCHELNGEDLTYQLNHGPIPVEQPIPSTSDDHPGLSLLAGAFNGFHQGVGTVLETLKNASWEQNVEIKSGNVYVLRRSTDDPVKPGDVVLFRFRSPTEIKNQEFIFARNPRAAVQPHTIPPPSSSESTSNSTDSKSTSSSP